MSMFTEPYEDEIYKLRERIKVLERENMVLKQRVRVLDGRSEQDPDAPYNHDYWDLDRDR